MRPPVDVVVPFVGADAALDRLCRLLETLEVAEGDSLTVVDNRRDGGLEEGRNGRVRVIPARATQTSYFARNAGASAGSAPWILFLDADVRPPADLIDRYFARTPAERIAVLAGEIGNEAVADAQQTLAARYSAMAGLFAQSNTFSRSDYPYAMTANCAVRRVAFDEVSGFVEHIRSGGDADICFRLDAAGWGLEGRPAAAVVHVNRPTFKGLLRQAARHGSGAEWLDRLYPGFSPRTSPPRLLLRYTRRLLGAATQGLRGRRDRAFVQLIDLGRSIAFESGRHISNETPG